MRRHPGNRPRASRGDRKQSRGTILLAAMMTASFMGLMTLGMVSVSLSERVRGDQVIRAAKAFQLARSGLECALWEINYSNADYSSATDGSQGGWVSLGGNQYRYTNPTALGDVTVTVIDPDASNSNQVTISSQGKSGSLARTVSLRVPARGSGATPPPALYNQILYADYKSIHLDARNGEIVLDGYNSDLGPYDANLDGLPDNPLGADEVIIMNDLAPFRHQDWNQPSHVGDPTVAPIILEGNVKARAKVVFRTPASGEIPVSPWQYVSGVTGFANKISGAGYFTGTITQETRTTSLGFVSQIKVGPEYNPYDLNDALYYVRPDIYLNPVYGFNFATDVMVICPGETIKASEVTVQDARLVVGCTTGGPYDCNSPAVTFKDFYGSPKSCAGSNPAQRVTISTAAYDQGLYALSVSGAGQIVVASPTDIYYNRPGTSGNGLYISGNGIRNEVRKANGAVDPKALAIYGGANAQETTDTFATTEPFYGTIFNPYSNVYFSDVNGFNFYGSINARGIKTSSSAKIHWDFTLKTSSSSSGGGCDPQSHNCRPISGTWALANY